MPSPSPDRYDPLPSLPELPAYLLRRLPPRVRRVAIAGLAALALALIAGAAVVIPAARESETAREQAAERKARAAAAARFARLTREARPQTGRGPAAAGLEGAPELDTRRALLAGLEGAILADARERAKRRELRGVYRSASCFTFPKGLDQRSPADRLDLRTATLECLAVSSAVPPSSETTGSLVGQPFRARIDFARGRYTWCKIVQRPGELSFEADAVMTVPRACGGS